MQSLLTLGELLPNTALEAGVASLEVSGVTADSREAGPGRLFVAVPGLTVDGHDYVAAAAEAGAVAVVAERQLDDLTIPCVVVDDTARTLGLLAARLAGDPAEALSLIGITGTNGKTTTSYLIEGMLGAAGLRPGVIGTVAYRFADQQITAPFTTPTPVLLQRLLAQMVTARCGHVVIEVSSHALELGRVWGCRFDVAAFSHLSQDHLDLHGDMRSYLRAKLRLFREHLLPGGVAVVNLDGEGAAEVAEEVTRRGDVRLLGCSRRGEPGAAATLERLTCDIDGLRGNLRVGDEEVTFGSPLLGDFNADNLLLAAACCHAVGAPLSKIAEGAARQRQVPGRLERVASPEAHGPAVLVDYAHTPDALARALGVLGPLCRGRLLAVFGCGGDRDRAKRPLMGAAVAAGADLALLTSDNPRSEDPLAIIAQTAEGLRGAGVRELKLAQLGGAAGGAFAIEADRRAAIHAAIAAAGPDDVVLIAGKGHEDYQLIGAERLRFDDREEARLALAARARGQASPRKDPPREDPTCG